MAMDTPNPRIIGPEPDYPIRVILQHESVPQRWDSVVLIKHLVRPIECPGVRERALEDLKLVPVDVPGVEIAISVVDYDFDDFVVAQDDGVYLAVDFGAGDVLGWEG